MKDRIVVGVDWSDESRVALRWAAREAGRRGVPLEVIHAWLPLELEGVDRVILRRGTTISSKDEARDLVDRLLSEERLSPLVPTSRLIMDPGPDALIAASEGAGLLVVGSRPLSRIGRLVVASTSRRCATHAASPVAIVRAAGPSATGHVPRIVVGFDGSAHGISAREWALDEGNIRGAAVQIVSVVPAARHAGRGAAERVAAEQQIADAVAFARQRQPWVSVMADVITGQPAHVLGEAAAQADLLVVGARGRSGVLGALLGSVVDGCLSDPRPPVIVVVP